MHCAGRADKDVHIEGRVRGAALRQRKGRRTNTSWRSRAGADAAAMPAASGTNLEGQRFGNASATPEARRSDGGACAKAQRARHAPGPLLSLSQQSRHQVRARWRRRRRQSRRQSEHPASRESPSNRQQGPARAHRHEQHRCLDQRLDQRGDHQRERRKRRRRQPLAALGLTSSCRFAHLCIQRRVLALKQSLAAQGGDDRLMSLLNPGLLDDELVRCALIRRKAQTGAGADRRTSTIRGKNLIERTKWTYKQAHVQAKAQQRLPVGKRWVRDANFRRSGICSATSSTPAG